MTNVVQLSGLDDDDEEFQNFIKTLESGNETAIFLVKKKDGTLSIGSTAKSNKDLLWDLYQLQMFMQDLVRGG